MRPLIYSFFATLDGYIDGPNREIDWHVVDAELHEEANEQQKDVAAYLFGRRMYEVMSYWDTAGEDRNQPSFVRDFAREWLNTPKIVFSRTLETAGPNATIVREVDRGAIEELKAKPGNASLMVGGAGLARTFIDLGLVDEYGIFVHPILLGGGTRMFPSLDRRHGLKLISCKMLKSGVTHLRYRPS